MTDQPTIHEITVRRMHHDGLGALVPVPGEIVAQILTTRPLPELPAELRHHLADLAGDGDTDVTDPETPADLFDRLRPVVTAPDPSETDDDGRHHRLRYRPTAAELTAARTALQQIQAMPDRHIMDPATTDDAVAEGWERHAAELDLGDAAEAIAQFAAALGTRGVAVPHLFGPRTLATAALEALDEARARAVATDEACERSLTTSAGWRTAAEDRADRLALTLREILDAHLDYDVSDTDVARWRAVLDDTGTRDQRPVNDQPPTRRECTALCRDIEADRDRMTPVVDAARQWRHAAGLDDGAAELIRAVDAYEDGTGTEAATSRPSADDVHLTGPADTPLGRATVALAAHLATVLDAEELASIVLDAAGPQYDTDDYPEDYPDDGGMPRNLATEASDQAPTGDPNTALHDALTLLHHVRDHVGDHGDGEIDTWTLRELLAGRMPAEASGYDVRTEWGVRAYYRDGTTTDHGRDSEADARESLATVRLHVATGEGWAGADLVRRTVGPWDVVSDGPEPAPNATKDAR